MADVLTTITHLINSPPGQLVAGGVLAGIVWKFFERVEAILTDQTKLEIAVWLLGRKKFGPKMQPWPGTFAKVFDRVFGTKHLSWKCLWRSTIAVLATTVIVLLYQLTRLEMQTGAPILSATGIHHDIIAYLLIGPMIASVLPGYLSLLQTRLILHFMRQTTDAKKWLLYLLSDFVLTAYTSVFGALIAVVLIVEKIDPVSAGAKVMYALVDRPLVLANTAWHQDPGLANLILPCLSTSIWLWLYAGSGFLLKAARRFDIGFDWFNRKFDIEKKPLQSIGLVAGALVAVVYWTAVIVSRVVG
jgi:hypothetical protein